MRGRGPWLAERHPEDGTLIELALALAVTGVAAYHDLRTRMLPDWLTLGAAALGVAVHVVSAGIAGAHGIDLLVAVGESAIGALACAVLPFLLVRKNAMGRGDLKLFIALGAVLGPALGFEAQIYAMCAAFVAVPVFAWRTGRLKNAFASAWSVLKGGKAWKRAEEDAETGTWMPFAPAILVGVFVAVVTRST